MLNALLHGRNVPCMTVYTFPVLTMSMSPSAQDQENFVRTNKFFIFLKNYIKDKFKDLIRISKFKFSFQGLHFYIIPSFLVHLAKGHVSFYHHLVFVRRTS